MPKRTRDDAGGTPQAIAPDDTDLNPIGDTSHSLKYRQLSEDQHCPRIVMKCSLPGHQAVLSFSSFDDFERHHVQSHAHRCPECRKNFPSEHFLDLHIGENHDPLAEARRAKGEKTYRCFVEDCDKICIDSHKRRMHLRDKHMFPKNYDFQVVNTGIDKKSSMLRSRGHEPSPHDGPNAVPGLLTTSTGAGDDENESDTEGFPDTASSPGLANHSTNPLLPTTNNDVDQLTASMSSLKFVPPSVRFGRGGRRGGLSSR